jgi:hypothetical protein
MRRTAIAKANVIAVMEKVDEDLRLVYLKELPLETPHTAVIGTVRRLNEAHALAAGCLDKKTTATSKNQDSRRVSGHV